MTTLVLLPGMDGTGRLFDPLVSALSGTVPLKVVSYPVATPAAYEELERLAEASLPAEGPLILLGESFSGPIAISLAAKHPARVIGLVLCCSFARNPRPAWALLGGVVRVAPVKIGATRVASMALLGRHATRKLRTELKLALAVVSAEVLRARLMAVLKVDVSDDLARVKVPVLYLRASEDRIVPPSAAAAICSIQPRTNVVEIAGPHCLLQTAPAEASIAIRQFLRAASGKD